MDKKVAIIGAGACGLMLAVLLEKSNISYDLFNKGKIGRKILASGNGKCNIANDIYNSNMYHNNPLATKIVSSNQKALFSLFNELKIYTKKDSEGRMYPISESSQSVLNILLKNIKANVIDTECTNINKRDNKYYINNVGPYDYVVIAVGSNAAYKKPYPSLELIDSLSIKRKEFYPSLVGFITSKNIKSISGVRAKANVSLYQNNKLIHNENGEIIFKDNGISGICIMNLSSYYANLDDKNNCSVKIDLLYNQEYDDYQSVLSPKLYQYVKENSIDIHNFVLPITNTYDFEFAQVCNGGIELFEINDNLSLKKDNKIYVGGEIINADALCGGYNLMFAFCCSITIWKELNNEISNK